MLQRLHHAPIICSDYQRTNRFYSEVLGLTEGSLENGTR